MTLIEYTPAQSTSEREEPFPRITAVPDLEESTDDYFFEEALEPKAASEAFFTDKDPITNHLDDSSKRMFDDHFMELFEGFKQKIHSHLVEQLFQSHPDFHRDSGSINIPTAAAKIRQYLISESNRHITMARHLRANAIPDAALRPAWGPHLKDPSDYVVADIPRLEHRADAHAAMSFYIVESTPMGEEAMFEATEALIAEFMPAALQEVDKIISDQIADLIAKREAIMTAQERFPSHESEAASVDHKVDAPVESPSGTRALVGLKTPGVRKLTEIAKSLAHPSRSRSVA